MSESVFNARKQMIVDLVSSMMHKHYCQNNSKDIIALFDDPFTWFGTGDHEYAVGAQTVADIFRQFQGEIPKCNLSDEEYEVSQITSDVYLCSGRVWIATDPSTGICLRVHQRFTFVFRFSGDEARCCHIHISNPYAEMTPDDIGFPIKMAQLSYEYFQEQISIQKRQIEEQASNLLRMSFEDSLTGLFNRNKFNLMLTDSVQDTSQPLGIACFDLNGLKEVNDRLGHFAGDDLLRRTALHIRRVFDQKAYRIGGDEFVVIDQEADEEDFRQSVEIVRKHMTCDDISCAAGLSWRRSDGDVEQQFNEADTLMYQEKKLFYSSEQHNSRKARCRCATRKPAPPTKTN